MDSVLRGAATYLFVWLIFRMAGKRTLAQISTFDAVLLLIVSEATQVAMVDDDSSFTNTILLILTLLGLDVVFSVLKQRFRLVEKVMDGTPIVILDDGGLKHEKLNRERVDKQDILHAARQLQGLASMDQIAYAVLETTGEVTIVPKQA